MNDSKNTGPKTISVYSEDEDFDGLEVEHKGPSAEELARMRAQLDQQKKEAMETSMQELVIQDDHFDPVKVKINQKLEREHATGDDTGVEGQVDDGQQQESFVAGFDTRAIEKGDPDVQKAKQAGEEAGAVINGLNASLFDFDELQENLDAHESGPQPPAEYEESKKAADLMNQRKTIREKILAA